MTGATLKAAIKVEEVVDVAEQDDDSESDGEK
jgi:hypothetical protein